MWRPAAAVWEPCTAHAQLHVLTANGCEQQQQMERKVKILSMQKSPNGECIYLNRPSGTFTICDASPLHAQPSETCVCIRIGINMITAGWRCRPPATELLLRKQSLIAPVIQVQEQYIEKRQSDFYKFKCEQHGAAFRGVRCSLYRFRFHSIYINKQNARAHTQHKHNTLIAISNKMLFRDKRSFSKSDYCAARTVARRMCASFIYPINSHKPSHARSGACSPLPTNSKQKKWNAKNMK